MFKLFRSDSKVFFPFSIFVISSIVSYFYAFFKGKLNGDFLGYEFKLSNLILFLILLISISPFILLKKYHLKWELKVDVKREASNSKFFLFLFLLLIVNVFFTLLFGLGVMTKDAYSAPAGIKWLIQIINRVSYIYGTLLYLISCKKDDKKQFILIVLIIFLAYLRAGLGVIFYLIMIYSVKYHKTILNVIARRKIVIIIFSFIIPFLINGLYEIRSELRGQEDIEMEDPISGMFFGRLSNFSNTAVIADSPIFFALNMQFADYLFYQKQGIGGVLGQNFMPPKRPENIMYEFLNTTENENVSYMTGTGGILILSFFKSPLVAILNLINILLLVYLTYYFFNKIPLENTINLSFVLIGYTLLSGVSNELFYLSFSSFIYYLLYRFKII